MRRVIVDGYNVIKSDEQLLRLQRRSLEMARQGLIVRLAQATKLRHDQVTVVFDGWSSGAEYQSTTSIQGIRVVFSCRGERADDVIARLVHSSGDPSAVVVVSNDRELRQQCSRGGAEGSGAENLMRQVGPARRPRHGRSLVEEHTTDEKDAPDRRGVSPSKKGPARRLPKNQRSGHTPDYRF